MINNFFCFRNHWGIIYPVGFFAQTARNERNERNERNATNLDLDLVLVDLFGRHGSQEFAGDPGRHAWCNAAQQRMEAKWLTQQEGWLVLGVEKEAQNRLKHQEIWVWNIWNILKHLETGY